MSQTVGLNYAPTALSEKGRLNTTFVIEGILSFASNLLFIGVFFYTAEVFHWGLVRNFLLAAAQGAVYIVASLASQKVARVLGDGWHVLATVRGTDLIGVKYTRPFGIVDIPDAHRGVERGPTASRGPG